MRINTITSYKLFSPKYCNHLYVDPGVCMLFNPNIKYCTHNSIQNLTGANLVSSLHTIGSSIKSS